MITGSAWQTKYPTEKQVNRIKKIIADLGQEHVEIYFYKHFPGGHFDKMNRKQANKIITGLSCFMPKPVIKGVLPLWSYMSD